MVFRRYSTAFAVGFGPSTPDAMISAAVAETCGAAMLVPT